MRRAEQGLARAQEKITSLENRIGESEKTADRLAERGTEKPRLGWYRVLNETPLFRNPYEKAEVILYLSPERLVSIVDVVDGRWLKVLSRLGNPPGYIRKEDAVLIRPETGSR